MSLAHQRLDIPAGQTPHEMAVSLCGHIDAGNDASFFDAAFPAQHPKIQAHGRAEIVHFGSMSGQGLHSKRIDNRRIGSLLEARHDEYPLQRRFEMGARRSYPSAGKTALYYLPVEKQTVDSNEKAESPANFLNSPHHFPAAHSPPMFPRAADNGAADTPTYPAAPSHTPALGKAGGKSIFVSVASAGAETCVPPYRLASRAPLKSHDASVRGRPMLTPVSASPISASTQSLLGPSKPQRTSHQSQRPASVTQRECLPESLSRQRRSLRRSFPRSRGDLEIHSSRDNGTSHENLQDVQSRIASRSLPSRTASDGRQTIYLQAVHQGNEAREAHRGAAALRLAPTEECAAKGARCGPLRKAQQAHFLSAMPRANAATFARRPPPRLFAPARRDVALPFLPRGRGALVQVGPRETKFTVRRRVVRALFRRGESEPFVRSACRAAETFSKRRFS